MKPETTLDTLKPRHIPESEDGPLTQVPNADRFDTDESQPHTEGKTENEHFSKVKEKVQGSAEKVAGKTGEAIRSRGEDLANTTGSHLRDVEKSARAAAKELREGDPSYLSGPVETFSDSVANLADYFEKNDAKQILEDGKDVVRKYPAAVLGGLAFAGFVAGRYLKSSEKDS